MSKEEIQNRKEETYRKILDIAWEIATKEGMEAISIRKVAATLHFAPNNIYNYFQNKNELLYQLKKDAYEWTFAVVLKDIPTCDTIREAMETVSHRMLQAALQEPRRFIIMTSDSIMDSEEPLDIQINDFVAGMFQQGMESGEFREADPQMTASNVRTALIGFVRWVSAQKMTTEQANSYLDNFLKILFDGMEKK